MISVLCSVSCDRSPYLPSTSQFFVPTAEKGSEPGRGAVGEGEKEREGVRVHSSKIQRGENRTGGGRGRKARVSLLVEEKEAGEFSK